MGPTAGYKNARRGSGSGSEGQPGARERLGTWGPGASTVAGRSVTSGAGRLAMRLAAAKSRLEARAGSEPGYLGAAAAKLPAVQSDTHDSLQLLQLPAALTLSAQASGDYARDPRMPAALPGGCQPPTGAAEHCTEVPELDMQQREAAVNATDCPGVPSTSKPGAARGTA